MPQLVIADDEPMLRSLVRRTLRTELYGIIEAEDGVGAWELIRKHRPELAVLDIRMPGWNGLELTRMIKADPELASTKIVILTGETAEAARETALAAGADLYLSKPFSPLRLVQFVEAALGVD